MTGSSPSSISRDPPGINAESSKTFGQIDNSRQTVMSYPDDGTIAEMRYHVSIAADSLFDVLSIGRVDLFGWNPKPAMIDRHVPTRTKRRAIRRVPEQSFSVKRVVFCGRRETRTFQESAGMHAKRRRDRFDGRTIRKTSISVREVVAALIIDETRRASRFTSK